MSAGSFQQWIGMGEVRRGPNIDELSDGTKTAKFVLRTCDGKMKDGTPVFNWHTCYAYGRTAQVIGAYVHRYDSIVVMGKALGRWKPWTDAETGMSRIDVRRVIFTGNSREEESIK